MTILQPDHAHLFIVLDQRHLKRFRTDPLLFEVAPAVRSVQFFITDSLEDFAARLNEVPTIRSSADVEAVIAECRKTA
jgi:hypothetical protein